MDPQETQLPYRFAQSSSRGQLWSRNQPPYAVGSSRLFARYEAIKDSDDRNVSTDMRRPLQRASTSTPETLTRLFAVQAPTSPPSSRAQSFNQNSGPSRRPESDTRSFDGMFSKAIGSDVTPLPTSPELARNLLSHGLKRGIYTDVNIFAFGKEYKLHRIILHASPFFASAFSGPWKEASSQEISLFPEEVDQYITKEAFEFALKRLYFGNDHIEDTGFAQSLLATASWLEMEDLTEESVIALLGSLTLSNVPEITSQVTSNEYGPAGSRVIAAALAILNACGSSIPIQQWNKMPADIICEVVGGDAFFIRDEWERWTLSKQILNRRLKTIAKNLGLVGTLHEPARAPQNLRQQAIRLSANHQNVVNAELEKEANALWRNIYAHPEIQILFQLVDTGIHYSHLNFMRLQQLRTARDVFGVPILLEKTVSGALWTDMELRQKIITANNAQTDLQFAKFSTGVSMNPFVKDQVGSIQTPIPSGEIELTEQRASPELQQDNSSESYLNSNVGQKFLIPDRDKYVIQGDPSSYNHGVTDGLHPMTELDQPVQSPGHSYSTFAPFRFVAEFANPRYLRVGQRYYSPTFAYAGSLWNMYVCKTGRPGRGMHIGVYLHRATQAHHEVKYTDSGRIPRATVDERIVALERDLLRRTNNALSLQPDDEREEDDVDEDGWLSAPAGRNESKCSDLEMTDASEERAMSSTPQIQLNVVSSETQMRKSDEGIQGTIQADKLAAQNGSSQIRARFKEEANRAAAHFDIDYCAEMRPFSQAIVPDYTERRPVIEAYFKMYYHSRDGKSTIAMESAPEKFRSNKSWGWRSTMVLMDWKTDSDVYHTLGKEYLDDNDDEGDVDEVLEGVPYHQTNRIEHPQILRPEYSNRMKFTVVFGVV